MMTHFLCVYSTRSDLIWTQNWWKSQTTATFRRQCGVRARNLFRRLISIFWLFIRFGTGAIEIEVKAFVRCARVRPNSNQFIPSNWFIYFLPLEMEFTDDFHLASGFFWKRQRPMHSNANRRPRWRMPYILCFVDRKDILICEVSASHSSPEENKEKSNGHLSCISQRTIIIIVNAKKRIATIFTFAPSQDLHRLMLALACSITCNWDFLFYYYDYYGCKLWLPARIDTIRATMRRRVVELHSSGRANVQIAAEQRLHIQTHTHIHTFASTSAASVMHCILHFIAYSYIVFAMDFPICTVRLN